MKVRFSFFFVFSIILGATCFGQDKEVMLIKKAEADSLMALGDEAKSARKYEISAEHYIAAFDIYTNLNNTFEAAVANNSLARTYYSNYQDSLMLRADSISIELFLSVDSTRQAAITLNQLGNHMSAIGLNRESLAAYDEATKLVREIGDSLSVSFYRNNIGLVLKDLGEYQNALVMLYESLYLKENYGATDKDVSSTLLNIGLVLDLLNKPEESLLFYARAIESKGKAGDSLGIARVYSNMAVIHKNLENYDSAIHYIDLSNEILGEKKDDDLSYVNRTNLGNLFKRKGDFSNAKDNLLLALDLALRENDKNHIGDTYQNLGSLAFDSGDTEACIEYNLKALELTEQTASYAQMMEIHDNLQEAYAMLNRFKEAHNSAILSLQFRDSVYRIEQIKAAEELQTKYETEKKEEQITFQEKQLKQQSSIILRNKAIIFALAIIMALSIALVWGVRIRQRKEHEIALRDAELNAIINSQEKERKRFATDLHDGFGQLISVLKLNLGRLTKNSARDIELRQTVFEQSEEVINDMYAELRNICFDLMPQTLVKKGLPLALQEFAERINQVGTKVVEVLVFGMDTRLNELQEVSLYRVSQEWVNNVLKYSDASLITIQLVRDDQELTLTIEDNGQGFDPNTFFNGKGNGWRNINSRLNLIGGDFDLDSQPQARGSMVTINVKMKVPQIPTNTEKEITT